MTLSTIFQQIDNLRAELDELRPLDAEQEQRILQKFRLDWNYHSSNIEGNSLTYGETKALLLFGITAQGKPLRHHFEITGHNEAIKWVMDVVANKEPFTENLIRQLHTILLKEPYQVDAVTTDGKPTKRWIQVGQYKSMPNHVKTVTGETFYFAMPEETPSKMFDLINWFRGEMDKPAVNPLVLAAEFHYRFILIHPFDDGNGRIARLLMNFILLIKGLPPVIIKTEDKTNYFAALRQADAGILNGFVEYIGQNLIHSLELMVKAAKGESIEEMDDIDKEIALFKKELEGRKNINLIEVNDEIIKKVINETLNKFHERIYHKLKPLNDLFRENKQIIRAGNQSLISFKTLDNIINYIDEDKKVSAINWIYTFKEFKKDEMNIFSLSSEVSIRFLKYQYRIKINNNKLILEKLYTEQLTELEMTEIANQMAKSILEEIKSKIQK
jgi:Fic family protein